MYHVSFITIIRRTHVQVYTYNPPRSEVLLCRCTSCTILQGQCSITFTSSRSEEHLYRTSCTSLYIMYSPSRSKVHTFRCTSYTTHQDQKYMALVVSFIYRLLFQGRKFTLHNPSRSRAHVSEVHVFRCVIVYSPRRSKVLCTGSWLKPGRDVMLTPPHLHLSGCQAKRQLTC